jgi:hypothetical protein
MTPRLPRLIYRVAAVYGILVLAPQYLMEERIGVMYPPAITHPEHFYGFVGVALAWQGAFLLIAHDPRRYRALMPITVLEKLAFGAPAVLLFAQGRIPASVLGAGLLDLVLGALFVVAYLRTPRYGEG